MAWRLAAAACAAAVFAVCWLLRYNDPGGAFGGLTDDHFFYLVRGWQILYGDLPVRDFVDHGAPLFYYVGAAVQLVLGRGTWSEIVFCVSVLAFCASGTFLLAARASGSIVLALTAVAFQQLLDPRFYNYPKLLSYVLAIPAIWWFADRPDGRRRTLIAAVTVVAFLFRHDHGVFIGIGFATLLLLLPGIAWRDRLRHAALYAATVLLLLAPYLVFLQLNGGVVDYFQQGYAWAERDRARAPLVWPPLVGSSGGDLVAWIFYLFVALPFAALGVLMLAPDGFRPEWRHAGAKMATVAVLGIVLNAGFFRHPLEGRLADPSVPHAILLAWLGAAVARLLRSPRAALRPRLRGAAPALAAAVALVTLASAAVVGAAFRERGRERLENGALLEGLDHALERAEHITTTTRRLWPLELWADPDTPGTMKLAFYLRDCTAPDDRVFMGPYLPQVLALSRRAFAGGHADLRPGFFSTAEEQRLTVERLRRQSVPVALIATEDYPGFRQSFPIVADYFDAHYRVAGDRRLDERFSLMLLVATNAAPVRTYEPLDWPCFR